MSKGGERRGAGRPRHYPPLIQYTIGLTEEQAKIVRKWGRGSLSEGLRWLINAAAPLIQKVDDSDKQHQDVDDQDKTE